MISIIAPVYNVEKYLKRFIESVLNQTYSDFELILVNDGSTDNSLELCNEYAKKDERIRVLSKQNGGQGSARNMALDNADGEYVMFADSDDYIHPKMLERLLESIKDNDMAMCRYKDVNDLDAVMFDELSDCPAKNMTGDEIRLDLCTDFGFIHFVCWGKLIKASLLEGVRFPEDRLREDEFFAHRLYSKLSGVVCLEDKLYYYVHRESSSMTNKAVRMYVDLVAALYERLQMFSEYSDCVTGTLVRLRHESLNNFCDLYNFGTRKKDEVNTFLDCFSGAQAVFDKKPNKYDKLYYFLIKMRIPLINKVIAKYKFEPVQELIRFFKKG